MTDGEMTAVFWLMDRNLVTPEERDEMLRLVKAQILDDRDPLQRLLDKRPANERKT